MFAKCTAQWATIAYKALLIIRRKTQNNVLLTEICWYSLPFYFISLIGYYAQAMHMSLFILQVSGHPFRLWCYLGKATRLSNSWSVSKLLSCATHEPRISPVLENPGTTKLDFIIIILVC